MANQQDSQKNKFDVFLKEIHLKPDIAKEQISGLQDWDYLWAILSPINKAQSEKHEIELAKRLSSGQKALYFWWYLDAQVTNGGDSMKKYFKYLTILTQLNLFIFWKF